MIVRILVYTLLALLLPGLWSPASSREVQLDPRTLWTVEQTQAELVTVRGTLADYDRRSHLELQRASLDGVIQGLEGPHAALEAASAAKNRARAEWEQAKKERDDWWQARGLPYRIATTLRPANHPEYHRLHNAEVEAGRNKRRAQERYKDAQLRLERLEDVLQEKEEFAKHGSNLSQWKDARARLDTRIKKAEAITHPQLVELRRRELLLIQRLEQLAQLQREQEVPIPAPPLDIGNIKNEIEDIDSEIELYEAILQNTSFLLNPVYAMWFEALFIDRTGPTDELIFQWFGALFIDRTELRDELIFQLRDGKITREEGEKIAREVVEFDRHTRTTLREILASRRDRRDVLVAQLEQAGGPLEREDISGYWLLPAGNVKSLIQVTYDPRNDEFIGTFQDRKARWYDTGDLLFRAQQAARDPNRFTGTFYGRGGHGQEIEVPLELSLSEQTLTVEYDRFSVTLERTRPPARSQ